MAPYSFSLRVIVFVIAVAGSLLAADNFDKLVPDSIVRNLPGERKDFRQNSTYSSDQIVLLGDSIIQSVDSEDTDRRTIAAMLSDFTSLEVVDRSHGAYSQDEFHSQIVAIERSGRVPRAVIVPVNPRSFSPHWELSPFWQFSDFKMANRFNLFLALRALNVLQWRAGVDLTEKEYAKTPVVVNGEVIGLLGDPNVVKEEPVTILSDGNLTVDRNAKPSTKLRLMALSRYGFEIEKSKSFPFLKKSLTIAKRTEIPILFYITPIDWENLKKCLAKDELALVERNLSVIRNTLAESGVRWIDLSDQLKHEVFDYPDDQLHEHLNEDGRRQTAQALSRNLIK